VTLSEWAPYNPDLKKTEILDQEAIESPETNVTSPPHLSFKVDEVELRMKISSCWAASDARSRSSRSALVIAFPMLSNSSRLFLDNHSEFMPQSSRNRTAITLRIAFPSWYTSALKRWYGMSGVSISGTERSYPICPISRRLTLEGYQRDKSKSMKKYLTDLTDQRSRQTIGRIPSTVRHLPKWKPPCMTWEGSIMS